jgi:hypothetical protein
MFIIQTETLGFDSNAAILSVGIYYSGDNEKIDYNGPIAHDPENICYVKFDVKEQVKHYNRTINKDTVSWWKSQSEEVKKHSFIPSISDMTVIEGYEKLKSFVKQKSSNRYDFVWSRGYITPVCLESLFRSAIQPSLFKPNCYRELRTAIDILKGSSDNGYCEINNYEVNKEQRHIPHYNVINEWAMLIYGN